VRRLAARTPPDRDRSVDFLRAFSIAVVVLGHWLIAAVTWKGGEIEGTNALEVIDGVWIATWLLQVMPLFFFVGGFSNLRSWRSTLRKGGGYAAFLHGRLVRMMRPTVVFLGIGVAVTATLDAVNLADNVVFPASTLITRPLWFLGVYFIVVALAPAMVSLHERFGVRVVFGLVTLAAAVDVARFGFDLSAVGYVNYPAVWLLAHQLGFFYADGKLSAAAGRWMAVGGIAALAALVNLGPYPGSMVGLSTDEFSNMDPPTIVIVALTVWQAGLALALRRRLSAWLAGTRPWAAVIFVNSVIMTAFLWHLTAMLLGIGILYPLGWPQPEIGTGLWWALRPIWVAVLTILLAGFVALLGRFEQRGLGRRAPVPAAASGASIVTAAIGATLLVLGVLGFAMGGMHQLFSTTGTDLIVFRLNPFHNVLHLGLGWLFLWASVRAPPVIAGASAVGSSVLITLAIVGIAMVGDPDGNYLAANAADNVFHVAAAVAALVPVWAARRPVAPGRVAPSGEAGGRRP
jgi:fucose 4-O-acetylase-like acetyltransferase